MTASFFAGLFRRLDYPAQGESDIVDAFDVEHSVDYCFEGGYGFLVIMIVQIPNTRVRVEEIEALDSP
ncbi:MAG TPA: hypothetical protein DDZ44_07135 [Syntrophomonas wolfei]|uniref:Uncharacterized protein n=1 Tax=Syntrophomonas wolfei TaxID=863 RepID=A0A354YY98_9FIRM|nr:hypothetical protein [Syntrophomonas wolfei]